MVTSSWAELICGAGLSFSYRMQAEFPLVAKAPASTVYDDYNPDKSAFQAPVALTVE